MSEETEATQSVVVERDVPHTLEKVWRALTDPVLVGQWLMPNDFEPVVGRAFNFRAPAMPGWNGMTDCVVLAVEPNTKLSYTEQSGFRSSESRNYKGAMYGWMQFITNLEKVVSEQG